MKKLNFIMFITLICISFFVVSCGGNNNEANSSKTTNATVEKASSNVLSGDYICTKHWNDSLVGKTKLTFNGNSVSFAGVANTSYTIKDNKVLIDMKTYKMEFIMNGNTLTTKGPAGEVVYTKK